MTLIITIHKSKWAKYRPVKTGFRVNLNFQLPVNWMAIGKSFTAQPSDVSFSGTISSAMFNCQLPDDGQLNQTWFTIAGMSNSKLSGLWLLDKPIYSKENWLDNSRSPFLNMGSSSPSWESSQQAFLFSQG